MDGRDEMTPKDEERMGCTFTVVLMVFSAAILGLLGTCSLSYASKFQWDARRSPLGELPLIFGIGSLLIALGCLVWSATRFRK